MIELIEEWWLSFSLFEVKIRGNQKKVFRQVRKACMHLITIKIKKIN